MPDGGFSVDLAALRKHEDELRTLLGAMPDAAADLGNQWHPEVYGVIGEFFASALDLWNDDAVRFIGDAHDAGGYMADQLGAVREQYKSGDVGAAQAIKEIHTTLDEHVPPVPKAGKEEDA